MSTRLNAAGYEDIKPAHEFDARFVIDGQYSPLCGVKVWLPIDCHEDAHIQVTGSEPTSFPFVNFASGSSRLVSEIDPIFGFEVEADDLHVRSVSTTPGQRIHGTRITIDHISRLRFNRRLGAGAVAEIDPNETCTSILFRLSDLDYGGPFATPIVDYLGNRKNRVSDVKTLKMRLSNTLVQLELNRHWVWCDGKFNRLVAGSFPVLEIKNCQALKWGQVEEIQQMGRDACLLLTLAARHLTVMHVMVVATKERLVEEWIYPLNRQRSTTEENATGPLIDRSELKDYFTAVSTRWSALTDKQKDAVRLAVFSIHPFVQSSSEGDFLQMFNALEGLTKTWFPGSWKFHKKIQELVTQFPLGIGGLWPLISPNEDGLDAIRNHLAHGSSMRGPRQEALSVGADHLRVWIERILLAILAFPYKESPTDWLSKHVQSQRSELPRLRAAVKS